VATYANNLSGPIKDGTPYAVNTPLVSVESDLNNAVPVSQGSPVGVRWGEAILAVVTFAVTGSFATNAAYVVLQTSLDGVTWIDVAWAVWNGTSGTATFVLSGGVAGALAVQQSRQPGTAPTSNGAIQIALGGQIRFVGKASTTQSSSSSSSSPSGPAVIPGVTVSILFKLLGVR
jgi:hypothetical protein